MEAIKKVKDFPHCRETRECASPLRFLSRLFNSFHFCVFADSFWGLWEVLKPWGPEPCRVPYFATPSVAAIACANTGQMLTADFNPNVLSPLHFKNALHGQRTTLQSTQLST